MVPFSVRAKDVYLIQNFQNGSGGFSSILFSGKLGFSMELKWPGRETGHIHLASRLGMTGAIHRLFHQYAFTA